VPLASRFVLRSDGERQETASKEKGNEAPRVRGRGKGIALPIDQSRCPLRLRRLEKKLERYARSLGMLCKMSGVKQGDIYEKSQESRYKAICVLPGRRELARCLK